MKLNLKAGEHLRIENDSNAGFTLWIENNIIHATARSPQDPKPQSEVVKPIPDSGDLWQFLAEGNAKRTTKPKAQRKRRRP